MVKLHGNFIVYDLAVPKQLKKKNKGKLKYWHIRKLHRQLVNDKKEINWKNFR